MPAILRRSAIQVASFQPGISVTISGKAICNPMSKVVPIL
jgi:hypothetical protein